MKKRVAPKDDWTPLDGPQCMVCGHGAEMHGPTKQYPGSGACHEKDCDCDPYEPEEEGDDE